MKLHTGIPGLRLGALLIIAAFFAGGVSTANASYPQRTAAVAAFNDVRADSAIDSGWTGSVAGCQSGGESAASLASTLRTVNSLRTFAGVQPVTFDATMNSEAMSAALMTKAADDISHSPDSSWPCYSKIGADTAGASNLYLGLSGADAMLGYVEDPGVASLGHRRWLLDPGAMEFGSGSTDSTNALKVIGSYGNSSRIKAVSDSSLVAWPSPGWFPSPWIFDEWSVAIGGRGGKIDASRAQVAVTFDGSPIAVSDVKSLPDGSGTGETLGWNADTPASASAGDHEIKVSITGVKAGGKSTSIAYTVRVFDPTIQLEAPDTPPDTTGNNNGNGSGAGSGSGAVDARCATSIRKVKKTRKALAKAHKRGSKTMVRKAKKNLRSASSARKRNCS